MLISCVAYEDGKKLADIAKEDISQYVGRPECFVWVAMYEPTPAELGEMQSEFGLPEIPGEMRSTQITRRRSKNTGIRCSPSCIPSKSSTTNCRSARSIFLSAATMCYRSATGPARGSRPCANAASASPNCSSRDPASSCMRSWTPWSTAISRCSTARIELEKVEEKMFDGVRQTFHIEAPIV